MLMKFHSIIYFISLTSLSLSQSMKTDYQVLEISNETDTLSTQNRELWSTYYSNVLSLILRVKIWELLDTLFLTSCKKKVILLRETTSNYYCCQSRDPMKYLVNLSEFAHVMRPRIVYGRKPRYWYKISLLRFVNKQLFFKKTWYLKLSSFTFTVTNSDERIEDSKKCYFDHDPNF